MNTATARMDNYAGIARDHRIRDAQNAVIARMKQDLAAARNSIVTEGRIGDGLTCTVKQGPFSATLDLGKGMGGDAAGPSPGFFARAAIAGCVAMATKMLAARDGLRFEAVDVAVETDFDDSALFGLGTRHAAPLATGVKISVTTDEAEAAVRDIVRRALEMDPWYLALRDPQKVSYELELRRERESGIDRSGGVVA